ncbi:MAG: TRAP transporter large permease subunit [Flavobacteriaceae bacterium]
MLHLIAENLAPIMFFSLIVTLLSGFPAAFVLAANGLGFFVLGLFLTPYAPDVIQLDWGLLHAMPSRVFTTMANEVLLAIPFFTFMGLVLQRSGMAEDLLDTIGQVFGSARGGIAYAVIFVGMLLGATVGVLSASVIAMGLISLPIMLRYGYGRSVATGVIAASGTLALIMPPSVVLIVMADQVGRPVGDMYEAAFVPALILTGLYALWIFLVSMIRKEKLPALPASALAYREADGGSGALMLIPLLAYSLGIGYCIVAAAGAKPGSDTVILSLCAGSTIMFVAAISNRLLAARWLPVMIAAIVSIALLLLYIERDAFAPSSSAIILIASGLFYAVLIDLSARFTRYPLMTRLVERVTFVMVPPLLLLFAVLGTIFVGLATPTEAGAMGAVGAVLIAAAMRRINNNPERFNRNILRDATFSSARLSAFVIMLLIGAGVFSLTFYGVNGHIWVEHLLGDLPGGETSFLIVVALLFFGMAFFLDFFELVFILVPLLAPVASSMGIDMVWFGIVIAVTLQTAFLHPPFGFALLFLRSVTPSTPYVDKVTGETIAPVSTVQIYIGAIPFVLIQLLTVGLIIAMPALVTHYKHAGPTGPVINLEDQMKAIELPKIEVPTFGTN